MDLGRAGARRKVWGTAGLEPDARPFGNRSQMWRRGRRRRGPDAASSKTRPDPATPAVRCGEYGCSPARAVPQSRLGRHGGCGMAWTASLARVAAALTALAAASCAPASSSPAVPDAAKVSSIVIGRSSRTDVFTALGRPTRTQQSLAGESWVYEARTDDSGRQRMMSGAAAASGIAGAFVPYLGLVGSGLGLANAAGSPGRQEPDSTSMTVEFGANGIVRDCTYASTALPAGLPGATPGPAKPLGCQRPVAAAASPS